MTRLLHSAISDQAQLRPEATALVMGAHRVSYGELEAASNRLACLLREAGATRGDRIAVLARKSPGALIAFLAALKADCIYVPMDPASPVVRLLKILQACRCRILLAGTGADPAADELIGSLFEGERPRLVWLERPTADAATDGGFGPDDLCSYPDGPIHSHNTDEDAAHILFTSGSTGTPKGVVITHCNVLSFLDWAINYFDIRPGDRNSGHSPLQFDLSTFDIYGTLSAGAELHMVSPELNLLPHKLSQFIRDSELTQWFSVPSVLNHLAKFDALRQGDFPQLKRLMWCGEALPAATLIYWMRRLPHAQFTNLYGPTETTIASSYYTVPQCPQDPSSPIPIGAPCAGETLHVLDEDLRPCEPEKIGHLYIGGVGLSPGYWQDPEKTAAAFRMPSGSLDPAERIYRTGDLARIDRDGLVYCLGRVDSQIKCRGYRIELGEIETALTAIDGLSECAVVAIPTDGFEGSVICCAYSLSAPGRLTPQELRRTLSRSLPTFMLPTRWMCFDQLPRNANGKTDRPRLKSDFEKAEATRTPSRPSATMPVAAGIAGEPSS